MHEATAAHCVGWVIEMADSHPESPTFFAAYQDITPDYKKAALFAKKSSAIQVAESLYCKGDFEVKKIIVEAE